MRSLYIAWAVQTLVRKGNTTIVDGQLVFRRRENLAIRTELDSEFLRIIFFTEMIIELDEYEASI